MHRKMARAILRVGGIRNGDVVMMFYLIRYLGIAVVSPMKNMFTFSTADVVKENAHK